MLSFSFHLICSSIEKTIEIGFFFYESLSAYNPTFVFIQVQAILPQPFGQTDESLSGVHSRTVVKVNIVYKAGGLNVMKFEICVYV